jgi:hypothetical protein
LRLWKDRRGISWRETALLTGVCIVALAFANVVFTDPIALASSIAVVVTYFVAMRILANRLPARQSLYGAPDLDAALDGSTGCESKRSCVMKRIRASALVGLVLCVTGIVLFHTVDDVLLAGIAFLIGIGLALPTKVLGGGDETGYASDSSFFGGGEGGGDGGV